MIDALNEMSLDRLRITVFKQTKCPQLTSHFIGLNSARMSALIHPLACHCHRRPTFLSRQTSIIMTSRNTGNHYGKVDC